MPDRVSSALDTVVLGRLMTDKNLPDILLSDKRIEEALQYSEERFQVIFKGSRDAVFITGQDARFAYVNPAACLLTGYSEEELLTMSIPDLHEYEDRGAYEQFFDRIMAGEALFSESPILRKDGSKVPTEFSNTRVIIAGEHYMHTAARDITERKQAEDALRESEKKFRLTFDASPDAVNINRLKDGLFVDINWGFSRLTGYTREDVIGKTSLEINLWHDPKDREKLVLGLQENGIYNNLEARFRRKDGSLTTALMSARVISLQNVPHIISVTRDISERKRAEEILAESETRFSALFHESPVSIIVHDKDTGEIVDANEAAWKAYGLTSLKALQANEFWLNPPYSFSEALAWIHKAIAEGPQCFEWKNRRVTGEIFWEQVYLRFLMIGNVGRVLATTIDITVRKKAEEEKEKLQAQLLQSRKMESIGTLAGGIAHNFNNTLSPLMLHAEMAMTDLPSDSPVRNNLQQIYEAGERARDLVEQILTFARKSDDGCSQIKASPVVEEAVKFLRSTLPATIDIRHYFRAEHDAVSADPAQLNQIIMNLCTNAAHAIGERGGFIEVILENEDPDSDTGGKIPDLESGRYVKLSVKDTGHGIGADIIDKIFDPYFTTREVGKGTGMGLALVHGIVKSCGGSIAVQSDAGKGAAFHVYLPLAVQDGNLTEAVQERKPTQAGRERILFVDDEQVVAVTFKIMLERLGYKVTARTSSIEALGAFRQNPEEFDLVITDQTMPDMTGKELAGELMLIRPDIPVILCTGFSEHIDEKKAKEMGIRAFLLKPIVMSQIADIIREVLDKPASTRE